MTTNMNIGKCYCHVSLMQLFHQFLTFFFCRHVVVTKEVAKFIQKNHLMSEAEWRSIGVQMTPGWIHYMIHEPEPHILLFRRPVKKAPSQEEQYEAEAKMIEDDV